MTFSSDSTPLSDIEKLDLAHAELAVVEKELREERRIINRDWAQMSPRERSSQSRVVKELENRRDALQETVLFSVGIPQSAIKGADYVDEKSNGDCAVL